MNMIGIWSQHAATYLLTITVATLFIFSIPLFFRTLFWARMFQWTVPEHTHLAVYLGRSLGSFALVTNGMFVYTALTGHGMDIMLMFFALFCALMVVIHIWGAIEGTQPMIETLEIGLWLTLLILNLLFMPTTP